MHEIPTLDRKGLRNFGLMFGVFVAALFGLLFPFLGKWAFPIWPWILAGIFWAWALIIPTTLNPFYRMWMRIGLAIGTVVNKIILAFVFYVVILPMSIIMKLIGRDPMARKLDKTIETYRVQSKTTPPNNLEKPF